MGKSTPTSSRYTCSSPNPSLNPHLNPNPNPNPNPNLLEGREDLHLDERIMQALTLTLNSKL